MSFAITGVDLEITVLSQNEKDKYHTTQHFGSVLYEQLETMHFITNVLSA